MERKRCQICDAPVVNGRCKLCGMPYRNDELLYHLNENRSDHYRHATSKARAMMRQDEIPLGDKKLSGNSRPLRDKKPSGNSKPSGNNKPGNPGMYKANVRTGATGNGGKKSNVYTRTPAKKKKHWFRWLILAIIIFTGVPGLKDSIQESVMEEFSDTGIGMTGESYAVKMGDTLVIDSVGAGYYTASCDVGIIYFTIQGSNGESGRLSVAEDEECRITLNEGDMLQVISADPKDATLQLTLHEN